MMLKATGSYYLMASYDEINVLKTKQAFWLLYVEYTESSAIRDGESGCYCNDPGKRL